MLAEQVARHPGPVQDLLQARAGEGGGEGAVPGDGAGGGGVRGPVETLPLLPGAQEDERQRDGEDTEAGRDNREI